MKPSTSALRAILAQPQFYMADCYSFTLVDGTVLRYTTADLDLTGGGNVFSASGPRFSRSSVKLQAGVQVDELDIAVSAGSGDLIEGTPWLQALRQGLFDGAEVQLDRAFMSSFGDTSAGLVTIFAGRIAEIDLGRTEATIKANTHLELLTQQMPRRLFQSACAHTLFDSRCGLTKSTFGQAATVTGASAPGTIMTGLAQAAGWATLGTVTFTSGILNGKSFTIREHDAGGGLITILPLPQLPAPGDTLTVYPGCDRQQATCSGKFNNLPHFGGFPYVPVPETAV
jgi:uncharacterized phage protein (TIGR02218 family)